MSAQAYLTDAAADLRNSRSRSPELHEQRQRNLINQRNFRSRRKQYVVELEQKIRAYEQAGVVATKRVQTAARAVAAENAVLRNLASTTLGWNEQELDRFISLRIYHNQTRSLDETGGTRHYYHCKRGSRCLGEGCEQQLITSPHPLPLVQNTPNQKGESQNGTKESTAQLALPSLISQVEARDLAVVPRTCAKAACKCDEPKQNIVHQGITLPETEADAIILAENPKYERPNENMSSDSRMSCEQAAAILSELRVQESLELIREELGCSSLNTCKVTHEELFQKMDNSV